ncbi:MAG: arylsulfatase, partial [Bacteroidetes bacterium]
MRCVKIFSVGLMGLMGLGLTGCSNPEKPENTRGRAKSPNIVLIVADDHGTNDLG